MRLKKMVRTINKPFIAHLTKSRGKNDRDLVRTGTSNKHSDQKIIQVAIEC